VNQFANLKSLYWSTVEAYR